MATIPVTRATDANGDAIELPDEPNVGQFGNTGERLAAINDAITYANAAKEYASEAGTYAAAADDSAEAAQVYAESADAAAGSAADSATYAAGSAAAAAQSADAATNAATEADAARDLWQTMKATAETLPPGDPASAFWDAETGTLQLALPRGMDGTIADMGAAVTGKPDAGGYVIYANAEGEISKAKVSDLAGLLPKGIHQRGTVDASTGEVIDWEGLLTEWSVEAPPVKEGESPDGAMFVVTAQGALKLAADGEEMEFYPGDQLYWQTDGGGWQVNYQQVTSVNGKTRAVVLAAKDVGALPAEGGTVEALTTPDLNITPGKNGLPALQLLDSKGVVVAEISAVPNGSLSLKMNGAEVNGDPIEGVPVVIDRVGNVQLDVNARLRGTRQNDSGSGKTMFDMLSPMDGVITLGAVAVPLALKAFSPPTVTIGDETGIIFSELNPPSVDQIEGAYSEANPPTNYGWTEIGNTPLNSILENGYFFQSDYTVATPENHYPEKHTGFLWVLHQEINTTQIWVTQGTGNIYTRSFAKATGWVDWQRLVMSGGGAFTGAISVPGNEGLALQADDSGTSGFVSCDGGQVFLAQQRPDEDQPRFIGLSDAGEPVYREATPDAEPGYTDHKIYHEGYQPPASNLQTIIDAIYPVGICLTFVGTADPNKLYAEYGHVWENLAETMGNRAIVINPDATGVGVGSTKGADTHSLVTAELPKHAHAPGTLAIVAAGNHTHTGTATAAGNHTHTGTAASAGAHAHNIPSSPSGTAGKTKVVHTGATNAVVQFPTASAGAHTHPLSIAAGGNHTHPVTTVAAGNHTHTLSGVTGTSGDGAAFSLWQPSVLLNVWKRIK